MDFEGAAELELMERQGGHAASAGTGSAGEGAPGVGAAGAGAAGTTANAAANAAADAAAGAPAITSALDAHCFDGSDDELEIVEDGRTPGKQEVREICATVSDEALRRYWCAQMYCMMERHTGTTTCQHKLPVKGLVARFSAAFCVINA